MNLFFFLLQNCWFKNSYFRNINMCFSFLTSFLYFNIIQIKIYYLFLLFLNQLIKMTFNNETCFFEFDQETLFVLHYTIKNRIIFFYIRFLISNDQIQHDKYFTYNVYYNHVRFQKFYENINIHFRFFQFHVYL